MTDGSEDTAQSLSVASGNNIVAALTKKLGGVRGAVDSVLPALVFVLVFTIDGGVAAAVSSALAVTAVLMIIGILRGQPLKRALAGIAGVALGAAFALMSGDARDFFLPSMLIECGLAVAVLVSIPLGYPLVGVALGPVLGEGLTWRVGNPKRYRAYAISTWAWGIFLLAKSALFFGLYWWGTATALGWAKIILRAWPLLLGIYLTGYLLSKAPAHTTAALSSHGPGAQPS